MSGRTWPVVGNMYSLNALATLIEPETKQIMGIDKAFKEFVFREHAVKTVSAWDPKKKFLPRSFYRAFVDGTTGAGKLFTEYGLILHCLEQADSPGVYAAAIMVGPTFWKNAPRTSLKALSRRYDTVFDPFSGIDMDFNEVSYKAVFEAERAARQQEEVVLPLVLW